MIPAKNILTILLRDKFTDTNLWNALTLTFIHIVQIIVSCILVINGVLLH